MSRPSLWQEQHPGRRFPALRDVLRSDVCVVGAGITGAACAWRLLEQGVSVAILEAREVAAGASGRNGGFAVTGMAIEHGAMVERIGAAPAARLHRITEAALDEMVGLAAELRVPEAIRRTGSLWLGEGEERSVVPQAVGLAQSAGIECRMAPELIPEPLRAGDPAAAFFPNDAELMPAAWVRALTEAAADRGARVFEHSPVTAITPDGEGWIAATPGGAIHAQAVVVACDGLISRLIQELDAVIYPVRGQVAATAPLDRTPLPCPTHSQFGFMYYRPTSDRRVVVGGGRLEHLESEYTDEERTTVEVQDELDRFLERLGVGDAPITHRWAGVMGFSADLMPVVGELPGRPGLHVAGGYSGVGNVHGYLCGGMVADLIASGDVGVAEFDVARFQKRPSEQLEKVASRALARSLGFAGRGLS